VETNVSNLTYNAWKMAAN